MLIQEALVARFAGGESELAPPLLERARIVVGQHLDAIDTPVTFACLYGDDAAISVGYPPLGVPAWGGLAVAASWASSAAWNPRAALAETPADGPPGSS